MSEQPSKGRRERIRALRRRILLALTGQILLRRKQIPEKARRILWYYDWSTLGDSIMDLSQRFAIPEGIELNLLMPNGPATIFADDSRIAKTFRCIEEVDRDYDFILIQDLSTRSLSFKLKHFFATPFASVYEHLQEERFSRIDFAAGRVSELFRLPPFPPLPPSLTVPARQNAETEKMIVVAIGGNDPRRSYQDWAGVLENLVVNVLPGQRTPHFLLVGSGEAAKQALATIPKDFLAAHCDSLIDADDPRELVAAIAGCAAFIGADGGLMHIAAACDKPGLALFCEIRPEWRLHPERQLGALFHDTDINSLSSKHIAEAFIASLTAKH
ncbi:glycosyltransferase family 9 protein [Niveibacterium terrae]|uniref:glycosyltransferase family 9 protein n=1 Tax=Niveibacterium terrae TaxID=3373598 RepID=UPI003A903699